MSQIPPLHPVVLERFTKAFGEPSQTAGTNVQWSLRPRDFVSPVNILVNVGNDYPAVWVFDPHDPEDGVLNAAIREEGQIAGLIATIEDRARQAGQQRP